jgi:hypothetical protein
MEIERNEVFQPLVSKPDDTLASEEFIKAKRRKGGESVVRVNPTTIPQHLPSAHLRFDDYGVVVEKKESNDDKFSFEASPDRDRSKSPVVRVPADLSKSSPRGMSSPERGQKLREEVDLTSPVDEKRSRREESKSPTRVHSPPPFQGKKARVKIPLVELYHSTSSTPMEDIEVLTESIDLLQDESVVMDELSDEEEADQVFDFDPMVKDPLKKFKITDVEKTQSASRHGNLKPKPQPIDDFDKEVLIGRKGVEILGASEHLGSIVNVVDDDPIEDVQATEHLGLIKPENSVVNIVDDVEEVQPSVKKSKKGKSRSSTPQKVVNELEIHAESLKFKIFQFDSLSLTHPMVGRRLQQYTQWFS